MAMTTSTTTSSSNSDCCRVGGRIPTRITTLTIMMMFVIGYGMVLSGVNIFHAIQESTKMSLLRNYNSQRNSSTTSSMISGSFRQGDVMFNITNHTNNSNDNTVMVKKKDEKVHDDTNKDDDDGDDLKSVDNNTAVAEIEEHDNKSTTTTASTADIISKQNHTTTTPSTSSSSSASFAECMLKLEQYLYPLIIQWYESSLPMPISVKIINNTYFVLLNLNAMFQSQFPYWTYGATYLCNDNDENKISGTAIQVTKQAPATLIVQCPSNIDPSKDNLLTFSILPKKNEGCTNTTTNDSGNCHYSNITKVTYNMTLFDECERHDIKEHTRLQVVNQNNSTKTTKAGITVTFAGSRKKILEWATYHHILGFDHIWIYVNDNWNGDGMDKDGKYKVSRDYITWIPWDYNMYHYNRPFDKKYCTSIDIFRVSSQNDALWRARRLGFDWMSFPDLDEFVVVNGDGMARRNRGKNMTANTSGSVLKDYLDTFEKADDQHKYDGIMLPSVPFGGSGTQQQQLILDYTWRYNATLTNGWTSRNKLLVKVARVPAVNIHFIGKPGGKLYIPPAKEIRVNHYKQPEKGVFNGRHYFYTLAKNEDIIQDTQIRDEYHDELLAQMKTNE